MTTLVLEHIPASELPAAWRAKLRVKPTARVRVRIEPEQASAPLAATQPTANPLFGLWRNRDELGDVGAYVRELRANPRAAAAVKPVRKRG